jgi:hypothetical protein
VTRIGVTGHQVAPDDVWEWVANTLRNVIRQTAGLPVCLTSLARGADQLMAELVLEAGGSLEVIVPSDRYETTFQSLDEFRRYQRLLQAADKRVTLPFDSPSQTAFYEAGRAVVDGCDLLIAVWDGGSSRGLGGTADVVSYARDRGRPVEIVWPQGATRS